MTVRCPYCDQPLVEDDDVCWHCGRPVEGADDEISTPVRQRWQEEESGPPLTRVIVYGMLTLFVIVGALFLTAFLGRQPRPQPTVLELADGWRDHLAADRTFRLYLPEPWETWHADDEDRQPPLHTLLSSTPLLTEGLQPFFALLDDLEPVFLSMPASPGESGPDSFLIVARSARLNRLTPAEAIGIVQSSDVALLASERVETYDQGHTFFSLELPDAGSDGLLCQQKLYQGRQDSLLVSACTQTPATGRPRIEYLLESFQYLAE